jgi:hypothetical protein
MGLTKYYVEEMAIYLVISLSLSENTLFLLFTECFDGDLFCLYFLEGSFDLLNRLLDRLFSYYNLIGLSLGMLLLLFNDGIWLKNFFLLR